MTMRNFALIILFTLCGTLKSWAQGMSEAEIRQHLGQSKYTPVSRDLAQRQVVDTAVCFVTYQYSYVVDTAENRRYTEPMIVEIGRKMNHYYSRTAEAIDSVAYALTAEHYNTNSQADGVLNPANSMIKKDETATYIDIYTYPSTAKRTESLRVMVTDYIYEEPLDAMQWQMLPEMQEVLGYMCAKAQTLYRGRQWVAWFALDLPFSYGPWKFCGLPGMILKAEDSEGLFCWTAIGIEQPNDRPIYRFDDKLKPSFGNKYTMGCRFKTVKREELAKFWQRQWVAPATMYLLGRENAFLNVMDPSGQTHRISINMSEMPKIYYPRLELE